MGDKKTRWQALFDWLHDIATMLKTNGLSEERHYNLLAHQLNLVLNDNVYLREAIEKLCEEVQALRDKPCTCTCPQSYRYWGQLPYYPTWSGGSSIGPWETVASSTNVQGGAHIEGGSSVPNGEPTSPPSAR